MGQANDLNEKVRVEFEPPRSGWMLSRFKTASSFLEISASHTPNDSIGDLAGAISLLIKGGTNAKVSFNAEPTVYELYFCSEDGNLLLRVFRFDDSRRTKSGKEVFTANGSRSDICLPFWRALRRLQSAISVQDYEAAWGHRFPEQKMQEIATNLE